MPHQRHIYFVECGALRPDYVLGVLLFIRKVILQKKQIHARMKSNNTAERSSKKEREIDMAEHKTTEQKIEQLEKKIEQLKAQKKAIIQKENKIKRAERTRRLIQNGALAEKYLNCSDIEPEKFEKLLAKIVEISEVKTLIKEDKNE